MYILGAIAFLLFFLQDYNDWKWKSRYLKFCFPAGCILLIVATVLMCLPYRGGLIDVIWLEIAAALAGLVLLWAVIYSLFFSFNRDEAYLRQTREQSRIATTEKMYAICRHPGVLFFVLLYVDLWLCAGMDFKGMVMLCLLNIGLAAFEDMAVFPAVFSNYRGYRQTTPFILPRGRNIRKCIEGFRG